MCCFEMGKKVNWILLVTDTLLNVMLWCTSSTSPKTRSQVEWPW
jgi:hypothetical protein